MLLKRTLSLVLGISVLFTSTSLSALAQENLVMEYEPDVIVSDTYSEEEECLLVEDTVIEPDSIVIDNMTETEHVTEEETELPEQNHTETSEDNFILESEVITDTSEEYQKLLLMEEELMLEESLELNEGEYSWIEPNENSCITNSNVHTFAPEDFTSCKCQQKTPANMVAGIAIHPTGTDAKTSYYYSDKFEDVVAYGNTITDSIRIDYELLNDYTYEGTDAIVFSKENVTLYLNNYTLNLGAAQLHFNYKVSIRKYSQENKSKAEITSTHADATIQGPVSVFNANFDKKYLYITNTGTGCAVESSSVYLSGCIRLSANNNHALRLIQSSEDSDDTDDTDEINLSVSYDNRSSVTLFESPENFADIYLNENTKICFQSSNGLPSQPYTVDIPSSAELPFTLITLTQMDKVHEDLKQDLKTAVFRPFDTGRVITYDKYGNLILTNCDHSSLNSDGTCSNCSEPVAASVTANGTTSNYLFITDALTKAVDGAAIKLMQNNLSSILNVSKNITLDLNGKTLVGPKSTPIIDLYNSNFIITDTSAEQSGKIIGSISISGYNTLLTIKGGHYERYNTDGYYKPGNFIIEYYGENSPILLEGGRFENGLQLTGNYANNLDVNDFIAAGYVYRDKDGNAISPTNEETSWEGFLDTRICTFSPLDLSKDVTATIDQYTFIYNGEKQVPTVSLSCGDLSLNLNDFTIEEPADSTSAGKKTLFIKPGNYGINELSVGYEIQKADLSLLNVSANDRIYNGTNQVKISGAELNGIAAGDDVSVACDDLSGTISSANAGEYTSVRLNSLTLSGKDSANYEIKLPVEVKTAVTISPRDIKDAAVTLDGTLTCNGKEQEQKVLVSPIEGKAVTYIITGNKVVNPGDYELTIHGTGNYTGSIKVPFTVSCSHKYVPGSVITAPTVFEAGLQKYVCSICGDESSKTMTQLEPTIKLSASKLPLKIKKSVKLNSLVSGLASGDSIKSWSLTKKGKSYATLKGDKLTGKKAGTISVTVTLASGKKASIKVTIQKKDVATKSIKVDSAKITLQVGKNTKLKPIITPITSTCKTTYKTSNKKVATVSSSGKIVAKAPGKAVITIKSGSKTKKVTVTVPVPKLKGIKLSVSSKTLKKGKSFTLKANLQPNGAVGKITYSTSNSKVAVVNKKGKVTAKGKGKAVITVKAGSFREKCTVKVK